MQNTLSRPEERRRQHCLSPGVRRAIAGACFLSLLTVGGLAYYGYLVTVARDEAVASAGNALIANRNYAEAAEQRFAELEREIAALRSWLEQTGISVDELSRANAKFDAALLAAESQSSAEALQQSVAVARREANQIDLLLKKTADLNISSTLAFGRTAAVPVPEMLQVPAGRFRMEHAEARHESEEVAGGEGEIAKPFRLSRREITFREYDAFALATGRQPPDDSNWGREDRPVVNVSWEDARDYARWLSEKTGLRFRLPTEQEWEYAARAGTETSFWWGDDVRENGQVWANCDGCGSEWDNRKTAPTGSFQANGLGLYDTAGNVWEWVADCKQDTAGRSPQDASPTTDTGSGRCSLRVIRGGSWRYTPRRLESAYRGWYVAGHRNGDIGFRLAQDLD